MTQYVAQNFSLILVDIILDENELIQFRNIINRIDNFSKLDECIQFIENIDVEKVFIIISEFEYRDIFSDFDRIELVYVYGMKKSKDFYTTIIDIYKTLEIDVRQCNQDCITLSFESDLIYAGILKEILPEIESNEDSVKNLAKFCREFYSDNMNQLNTIDEFERDYHPQQAIRWYLRECFLYQMLNRTFRTIDIEMLIQFGFFLRDLNQQIESQNQEQIDNYVVYHGQGLPTKDAEKLVEMNHGILSFHTFLLAYKNPMISLNFAKNASMKINTIGIQFHISIQSTKLPHVIDSNAVLFPLNSTFRIENIEKIDEIYRIDLIPTNEQIQYDEKCDYTSWQRLGHFFIETSQFDRAEILYDILFEQSSDANEKIQFLNKLGFIHDQQGRYEDALLQYQNALDIQLKISSTNTRTSAYTYNNIGEVYRNMGNYQTALSYYKQAHDILEDILPFDHPDLATSYNNLGLIYKQLGDRSQVLPYYEKAYDIYRKTLPLNHSLLATCLNNIAGIYIDMKQYEKALVLYEKTLKIYQQTLPDNHSLLALANNNLGLVYFNLKDYSKALLFYERTLSIRLNNLSENHPSLATSYNNLAWVFQNLGDRTKALTYFERSLAVLQHSLPANHPNIQSVKQCIINNSQD